MPIFELFAAPGPPDCGPVEDVEEEEQHWEDDQEGQVSHLMGEHVSGLWKSWKDKHNIFLKNVTQFVRYVLI